MNIANQGTLGTAISSVNDQSPPPLEDKLVTILDQQTKFEVASTRN